MSKNTDLTSKSPGETSELAEAIPKTPSRPRLINSTPDEAANAVLNINSALLRTAFGSEDEGFYNGLLDQAVQLTAEKGKVNPKTLYFVGGALTEINPRTGIEALLATQIVANHLLAMKMARLAITSEGMNMLERYEVMATKLMRTTTAQLEALHKLRNGGKQKVKVEHVHVHEGGQAIVGDVTTGGR